MIVTREAAELTLRADNPYTARYDDALPASWAEVQGADGQLVPNPVIDHEPYLPASFLVQVPFVAAATAVDATWDPRLLGWLALTATVVLVARRRGPAWARLRAVAAVGSAFTITYLAWGTTTPWRPAASCWPSWRPTTVGGDGLGPAGPASPWPWPSRASSCSW